MADAGTIGTYRPATYRQPLAIWAAGERVVTPLTAPVTWRQLLSVWAAGERISPRQYRRLPWRARMAFYVGGTLPSYVPLHDGRLAGTVQIDNVPQAGKRVVLIYRSTLSLIRSTVTDDNGAWEFTEIAADGQYLALAFSDFPGEPAMNAMAADYLTPVTS